MIEMNKKYKTRSGLPVRILCNDYKNNINKELAAAYDYVEDEESALDLIEVTPHDDFKEDDLCVVWAEESKKLFRYYSHVGNGAVNCFILGCTSYTTANTSIWPNCRKATDEEIKTKTIKD